METLTLEEYEPITYLALHSGCLIGVGLAGTAVVWNLNVIDEGIKAKLQRQQDLKDHAKELWDRKVESKSSKNSTRR